MNTRKSVLLLVWIVSIAASAGWLGLALWIDYPNMPDNVAEWTGAGFVAFLIFAGVWTVYFTLRWAIAAFKGRWLEHPSL